ncbi:hypothetical protein D3C80_1154130 [compost metagenome]
MQSVIGKLVFSIMTRPCQRLLRLDCRELRIDGAQVVQQEAEGFHLIRRCTACLNAIQSGVEMSKSALKPLVVLIRRSQQNGTSQLLTSLRLHRKKSLEAEHNVAVTELLAQRSVLNMR